MTSLGIRSLRDTYRQPHLQVQVLLVAFLTRNRLTLQNQALQVKGNHLLYAAQGF